MATFTLRADVAAPIETVFDVLADHRGYANITPLRSSVLEREGTSDPNGVGAIRVLSLVGPPIREEIVEFERPRRLVYKALSGVPAKHHLGTIELEPHGSGTRFSWHLESVPKFGALEPVWPAVMRPVINQLLKAVVKESERRARA